MLRLTPEQITQFRREIDDDHSSFVFFSDEDLNNLYCRTGGNLQEAVFLAIEIMVPGMFSTFYREKYPRKK